jgi:vanillate O-demethylase monooxygenase subunit
MAEDLKRGPKQVQIDQKKITLFKTESGEFAAIHSFCLHQNADLSTGKVCGEHLLCPFHCWKYNKQGEMVGTPDTYKSVRPGQRLKSYPIKCLNEMLFVFMGREALFDLPFFEGLNENNCLAIKPLHFDVKGSWYLAAANAFDLLHFEMIHARKLKNDPKIE